MSALDRRCKNKKCREKFYANNKDDWLCPPCKKKAEMMALLKTNTTKVVMERSQGQPAKGVLVIPKTKDSFCNKHQCDLKFCGCNGLSSVVEREEW